MSDAIRCGKCGYVYWSRWNENWGTCPKCESDNDRVSYRDRARLVSSDRIFTTILEDEDLE